MNFNAQGSFVAQSLVSALLASAMIVSVGCGNQNNGSDKITANSPSDKSSELNGKKRTTEKNLAELAASVPELSSLLKLVTLCELGSALTDPAAKLTVFAPTNKAFEKYLKGASLPETCSADLKSTLVYHIIPSIVLSKDLSEQQAVSSLLGTKEELFVTKKDNMVRVNGISEVVLADAEATNGVAHLVDTVLMPDMQGTVVDAAIKRYSLTSLVSAVVATNLADTLATTQDITVFAPVNEAFAELTAVPTGDALVQVLLNHVLGSRVLASQLKLGFQAVPALSKQEVSISLSESGAKIWGAGQTEETAGKIIQTDINTKNGVIHAISKVLLPK
jgi:transforming growth factor-beta-induced protein